jgi:hypothetical protein
MPFRNFAQSAAQYSAKIKAKLDAGEIQGVNQLMTSLKSAGGNPKLLAHYQRRVDARKAGQEQEKGPKKSAARIHQSNSTLLAYDGVVPPNGMSSYTFKKTKSGEPYTIKFPVASFKKDIEPSPTLQQSIENFADEQILVFASKFKPTVNPSGLSAAKAKSEGYQGALASTVGAMFESGMRLAFGNSVRGTTGGTFDVAQMPRELAQYFKGKIIGPKADFKNSISDGNRKNFANKIIRDEKLPVFAKNLMPNFSALGAAIAREKAAGIPSGAIRVGRSSQLVGPSNPQGLAVYNTIDEPRGLSQGINRYKSAGLNPKTAGMPNFAGGFAMPSSVGLDVPFGSGAATTLSKEASAKLEESIRKRLAQYEKGSISEEKLTKTINDLAKKANLSAKGMSKLTAATSSAAQNITPRARIGGMGSLGATMGLSMLAGGAEQFIPGQTGSAISGAASMAATGASLGMIFGPTGAAIGGVAGGLVGLVNALDPAKKAVREFAEAQKKAKEDDEKIQSAQSILQLKQTGEIDKARIEFAKLSPEIRNSIGGFDNLTEASLSAARRVTSVSNQMRTASANIEQLGQISFGQRFLSTNIFGENVAQQEAESKQRAAASQAVRDFLFTSFGNEPLANLLTEKDVEGLNDPRFQVRDTVSRISEQQNLEKQETALLARLLLKMRDLIDFSNKGEGGQLFRNQFAEVQGSISKPRPDTTPLYPEGFLAEMRYQQGRQRELDMQRLGLVDRMPNIPSRRSNSGRETPYNKDKIFELEGITLQGTTKQDIHSSQFGELKSAADNLKKLRDDAGFTQQQMDKIAGLSAKGDFSKLADEMMVMSRTMTNPEFQVAAENLAVQYEKIARASSPFAVFSDTLRFDSQDQLDFLNDSSKELANTMKSGFKDGFKSFIDGSKNASEAFRSFALTILDKLTDISSTYATNSLFAALGATGGGFKSFIGESAPPKTKARGGMITGGSGVRDDVPAMLMGGEYVVKKSAVDALGVGFLNRINSYAEGGVVASNQFQKGTLGTRGSFNVGKGLSALAITSDLNPQNALRDQMAQEDEQRVQRYLEYQERKKQAMDAYKQMKRQRRIGAVTNAALILGASAFENAKGKGEKPIEGPLMEDGSFYSPETLFPARVPTGRAQGGSMSTSIAPVKPLGTSSAPMPMSFSGGGSGGATAMLAASIQQLSQSIQSGGGAAGGETVVNLTFNIDKSGEAKAEGGDNKKNPGEPSSTDDQKKEKEFGEMIKSVVLETITKQKRPGGLLFKAS